MIELIKNILLIMYFYQITGIVLFYLLKRNHLRKDSTAVINWSLLWPIGIYLTIEELCKKKTLN